jgi:hypothetical protein
MESWVEIGDFRYPGGWVNGPDDIVPVHALAAQHAPIRVLEQICGRSLAA